MFAAEFGVGQVLWSIFWLFLFVMWWTLVFSIFRDIVRADDQSGVTKAMWTFLIIFLPFLGVFLYLVVNGDKMSSREIAVRQDQEAVMRDYIRDASGPSQAAELEKLAELHSSGSLDAEEYAKAKQRVIGS